VRRNATSFQYALDTLIQKDDEEGVAALVREVIALPESEQQKILGAAYTAAEENKWAGVQAILPEQKSVSAVEEEEKKE